MSSDLLNGWALVTLISEELEDEVLEVVTETSAIDFLEVKISFAFEEQVVEVFLLASLLEGEDSLDNDKEDDSNAEHVNVGSFVLLALFDLRGHVGHGAAVGLESVDVFVTGKSEVCEFQVKIVVN